LSASAELLVVLEAPRDQDPGLEDYITGYIILLASPIGLYPIGLTTV